MQRRCGGARHKETSTKKKQNKNTGKVDEFGGFPARSLNELGAPSTLEWTELLLLLLRIHVCRSEPRCSLSAGVSGWKSNPLADTGGGHRLSVSDPRRHIRQSENQQLAPSSSCLCFSASKAAQELRGKYQRAKQHRQ